jgi:peptidoglycan/LPS O-acetylase OafA/YrhL
MQGSRSPGLDAVRAVTAAAVFVHHLGLALIPGYRLGLGEGVIVFFVLSGYLLYRPFVVGRVDLHEYAVRRVARIVPAYWVALVGAGVVFGVMPSLAEFAFTRVGIVSVAWTLQLEITFYLSLPLLARLLAGSPTRILILAAVSLVGSALMIATLAVLGFGPLPGFFFNTYPSMLWAFAPGMFVAALEARGLTRGAVALWPVGIAMTAAGLWIGWVPMFDVVTAFGAALVVAAAVDAGPWPSWAVRGAAAGGALSYSVYLWHLPLIEAYGWAAVPATLLVAVVVYTLVERPAIEWAQMRVARRRAMTAVAGQATEARGTLAAAAVE